MELPAEKVKYTETPLSVGSALAPLFCFDPDLTAPTVIMMRRITNTHTYTQEVQCFVVGQHNGALLSHLQLSVFSFSHGSQVIPPLGGQSPQVASS